MLIPDTLPTAGTNATGPHDTATPNASDVSNTPDTKLLESLKRYFGTEFSLLDGETGNILHEAGDQPVRDWSARSEVCREVARRGRPEFLDDEGPFLTLALPIPVSKHDCQVAVATFVHREISPNEDLSQAIERLGLRPEETALWVDCQSPWPAEALLRMSELILAQATSTRRIQELEGEAADLSDHVASTYEEISLLYRLTQNLRISESDEDLGRMALEWMEDVLPASCLALQFVPIAAQQKSLDHVGRSDSTLLLHGDCLLDNEQFTKLVEHVSADRTGANQPVVINRPITDHDDWPFPKIHQLVVVPLIEGENLFGWLAALNHLSDAEFGTVEAKLLSSVAAILGIHSGNIELYRQQSELLAGIVHALTSAIDAKDPYTCGHSDRVAQVSVRLAQEFDFDTQMLNTIYLSGLLHDIGKIGIQDNVLRKPGRLDDEEYEHIKSHVEIGHRILRDLSKLEEVLPVVLYHHESWDGGGYPQHLGAEEIPLTARIVAVADSYDAMGSDRPYRKRMPDEKINAIFREGSGKQWDPEVVDAFFRARDDIRAITCADQGEPEPDEQPSDH
ncbi:MAG TPA: HD domain-containing phosphohydrolase [Thermoguttaceae bacterium]|nr:HD domain-containing phosphohydrolase [Thermoguttaceae bacterium]